MHLSIYIATFSQVDSSCEAKDRKYKLISIGQLPDGLRTTPVLYARLHDCICLL